MSKALMGRISPMKGKKFSWEHRQKISVANKGNRSNRGHRHTQATKDLMRLHHNRRSHPPKTEQQKKAISFRFKRWYASLTEDQKLEQSKKKRERGKDLRASCLSCGREIVYRSKGKKYVPKTCGRPECLTQLRRNILNARRQDDPGMDRRASLARERIRTKGLCAVCHKEFEYRSQKRVTCGQDCLTVLKRQITSSLSRTRLNIDNIPLEVASNEKVKNLCEYIKFHGHYPTYRSKDKTERSLGMFLGSKRQARAGRGSVVIYSSDQVIAESYSYPNLFDLNNPEANSNSMCKKVCEWIHFHGKAPTTRSNNIEEKNLAEWVHFKRKRLLVNKVYPSDIVILESYGYAGLFNSHSKKHL